MKFDTVVCFRPDIIPPSSDEIKNFDSGQSIGFASQRPGWANDIMFVANSETMDEFLTALFGAALTKSQVGWNGIHKEIYSTAVTTEKAICSIQPLQGIKQDDAYWIKRNTKIPAFGGHSRG